eukprot:755207-Hanusia_phi.AAC.2
MAGRHTRETASEKARHGMLPGVVSCTIPDLRGSVDMRLRVVGRVVDFSYAASHLRVEEGHVGARQQRVSSVDGNAVDVIPDEEHLSSSRPVRFEPRQLRHQPGDRPVVEMKGRVRELRREKQEKP